MPSPPILWPIEMQSYSQDFWKFPGYFLCLYLLEFYFLHIFCVAWMWKISTIFESPRRPLTQIMIYQYLLWKAHFGKGVYKAGTKTGKMEQRLYNLSYCNIFWTLWLFSVRGVESFACSLSFFPSSLLYSSLLQGGRMLLSYYSEVAWDIQLLWTSTHTIKHLRYSPSKDSSLLSFD